MNTAIIDCDVAVIGGGPSGLAAATRLRQCGVERVIVLERESSAGGIPRHCGHPPFGWREYRRVLTGPRYAARLVDSAIASGIDIRTSTTVTDLHGGPKLRITTPEGIGEVCAKRVILATGVRETPRPARMVSGTRPLGVMTTGALQSMVYLKSRVPFTRPVIVGTELVSFSALLTCRHVRIRPVAMIESGIRTTAWWPAALLPRFMRVGLLTSTELVRIEGGERVTGVVVRDSVGNEKRINCDGVVFSGRFTSESTLARMAQLEIDQGSSGPLIDQFGRCSEAGYFATGNMLHPADSAGQCWRDGVECANRILRDLENHLPATEPSIPVHVESPLIRYVLPQRLVPDADAKHDLEMLVRFKHQAKGRLQLRSEKDTVSSRDVNVLPESRVLLKVPAAAVRAPATAFNLEFHEK